MAFDIIRPATTPDIDFIVSLEQRPDFAAYIHHWSPEEHLRNLSDPDKRYLIGVDTNGESIAFAILAGILSPIRSIELVRMAVTTPGKGVEKPLLKRVIDTVFGELKANRLWLDVFEDNTRACHTYESVGFRTEGVLREAALNKNTGQPGSLVIMSILAKEYRTD
jgi:RimJ/RimL family protein N-acetyltransferase